MYPTTQGQETADRTVRWYSPDPAAEGRNRRPSAHPVHPRIRPRGSQLIDRRRKARCELCDKRTDVQVHQVRHLAELQAWREQPTWVQLMLKKRRRTLVVCPPCHEDIHA
ncbi:HNH endonuclease [Streptomyces malaysiensis]|uniref:HNH endonuclease n=1 Tax=Streptomyces malaysiensis TaxID=92644 RepID=UPI003719604A